MRMPSALASCMERQCFLPLHERCDCHYIIIQLIPSVAPNFGQEYSDYGERWVDERIELRGCRLFGILGKMTLTRLFSFVFGRPHMNFWHRGNDSVLIPTVDEIVNPFSTITQQNLAKSILGSFNLVHLPATAAAPNDKLVLTGWRSR
eukprot:scaffold15410_cov74-Skeletonema_dohrnii-CCMP3373.AAC.2